VASGTLYIIAAPSGGGKTSLLKQLLQVVDKLKLSISYTTRERRPGEEEGVNYFFIRTERFAKMIDENAFLEHALVFGHHYGTSKEWVTAALATGSDVILEIDWQGARQVSSQFQNCVSIFILPPSILSLEQRLRCRGRDEPAVIDKRMAQAQHEISHCHEFDYWVINEDFDSAVNDLATIICAQRLRAENQRHCVQELTAS
jgi:guanylate kinase